MRSTFSMLLLPLSLAFVVLASSACSGMAEKTRSASSTTAGIGNKVDHAIRRGLQSGSDAVGNAAKAAEGPIDRTAKKIGLPTGPVSPPTTDRGGN